MANNIQVDFQVTQLLCSRLCHDLAGPAGAVHNGMELLMESGGNDEGALGLVDMSVGQMKARLKFYRLAFGLGGLNGQKPVLTEARDLATGFLKGGRTTLDWPDTPAMPEAAQIDLNRTGEAAKLLLNMIIFGVESLPKGGVLEVQFALTTDSPAAIGLAVRGAGQGAFVKDERMAALSHGDADLSAHTIQGFFMQRLAESLDGQIEVTVGVDEVQIAALLPG